MWRIDYPLFQQGRPRYRWLAWTSAGCRPTCSIPQQGSSCVGPATRRLPSQLVPGRLDSWKLEVRCARRLAHRAASQRSAWSMTIALGPCSNPSIIDGSLRRLRIHALLTIR
jgi:hypothetical protein